MKALRQVWIGCLLSALLVGARPSEASDEPLDVCTAAQAPAPAHLDRIDQRSLPLDGRYVYTNTAAAVTFYVLTTGIRISHDEFGGRARYGYSAYLPGDPTDAEDCQGSGTGVASLIAGSTFGVAKSAKLVAVRVIGGPAVAGVCGNSGTAATVLAGLDYVRGDALDEEGHPKGPTVVVMPLASGIRSAAVEGLVAELTDKRIPVVVAAGNGNDDACKFSPGLVADAITVGASVTETDARLAASNWGSCVDLFAPGSDLAVAWHRDPDGAPSNSATSIRLGTSYSTGIVAGIAGLYLQTHPDASAEEVSAAILGGATLDVVGDAGTGSPNRLSYSLVAAAGRSPTITWNDPADITVGTPLDGTQLDASADTAGTFIYSPPAGALLAPGDGQTLSVAFCPDDTSHFDPTTASVTIDVLKAEQSIAFGPLPDRTYGDDPFTLSATASSGLPVSFEIVAGPATLSGSTVTITGAGTVRVRATQDGDATFNAATAVVSSFAVAKATPVISWAPPAAIVAGTPLGAEQLDATASVAGFFVYAPAAGTVLAAGKGQPLQALFTPDAADSYDSATATVLIDVLSPVEAVNALEQQVRALGLPAGPLSRIQLTLLLVTLEVAERALGARRLPAAVIALALFQIDVHVLVCRGVLGEAQGSPLIRAAGAIVAALHR